MDNLTHRIKKSLLSHHNKVIIKKSFSFNLIMAICFLLSSEIQAENLPALNNQSLNNQSMGQSELTNTKSMEPNQLTNTKSLLTKPGINNTSLPANTSLPTNTSLPMNQSLNRNQSETSNNAANTPDILKQIKALRQKNDLTKAKALGLEFLKTHPDDVDVMLLLGLIYYQSSQFDKAQEFLQKVLDKSPNYLDAKLGLIRVKIAKKQFAEAETLIKEAVKQAPNQTEVKEIQLFYKKATAPKKKEIKKEIKKKIQKHTLIDTELENGNFYCPLAMVEACLRFKPCDPDLIALKAKIFLKGHLYAQSAYYTNLGLNINPDHAALKDNLSTIKEIKPSAIYGLNQIGLASLNERVSDLNATWDLSTIYYARETWTGIIVGKMNYARRLGEQAKQGEIIYSPVINQYLYFDLYTSFAKKPELFPQYASSVEGYLTTPKFFTLTFSLGRYYAHIVGNTNYKRYTASVSKDLDKFWISLRSNHFEPSKGTPSTMYMALIRRYFFNNDCFLNLGFGYGTTPDLSDLQTLDFIVIRNKYANLSLRFPFFSYQTLIDVGVDYQHWKYPSGLTRILRGINVGLNHRF